jgi:hypothetical protein
MSNRLKKCISFSIISFCLYSCSTIKYPYDGNIRMGRVNTTSSSKMLPDIPLGWSIAEGEDVPKNISILLIENNTRAAISVIELKASRKTKEIVAKMGIEELGILSFEMKRDVAKDDLILCSKISNFEFNDKEFLAYQYVSRNNIDTTSVLLAKKNDNFIEVIAYPIINNTSSKISNNQLFSTQYKVFQKIINSKY